MDLSSADFGCFFNFCCVDHFLHLHYHHHCTSWKSWSSCSQQYLSKLFLDSRKPSNKRLLQQEWYSNFVNLSFSIEFPSLFTLFSCMSFAMEDVTLVRISVIVLLSIMDFSFLCHIFMLRHDTTDIINNFLNFLKKKRSPFCS